MYNFRARKNSNYCTGEREIHTHLSNLVIDCEQSTDVYLTLIHQLCLSSILFLILLRICHFPAGLCCDEKTLTLPWTPGREFGTQNSSGVWWAAFSSNPPEKRCACVCVSPGCKITILPHLPRVGEFQKVVFFNFFLLAV